MLRYKTMERPVVLQKIDLSELPDTIRDTLQRRMDSNIPSQVEPNVVLTADRTGKNIKYLHKAEIEFEIVSADSRPAYIYVVFCESTSAADQAKKKTGIRSFQGVFDYQKICFCGYVHTNSPVIKCVFSLLGKLCWRGPNNTPKSPQLLPHLYAILVGDEGLRGEFFSPPFGIVSTYRYASKPKPLGGSGGNVILPSNNNNNNNNSNTNNNKNNIPLIDSDEAEHVHKKQRSSGSPGSSPSPDASMTDTFPFLTLDSSMDTKQPISISASGSVSGPAASFGETSTIVASTITTTQTTTGTNTSESIGDGISFRGDKIDSMHIHIDGGVLVSASLVQALAQEHNISYKVTHIKQSVAGPQRTMIPYNATYASHTPGTASEECFVQYITIPLQHNNHLIPVLKSVLEKICEYEGIVVEVEKIIGVMDIEGNTSWSFSHDDEIICSYEVGYRRNHTFPFEIHYAIDVPKSGVYASRPPFEDLRDLSNKCHQAGVTLGGWFLAEKGNRWAFRSNLFSEGPRAGLDAMIKGHWKKIKAILDGEGITDYFLSGIVERVQGIWKTPLQPHDLYEKDVEELAVWERTVDQLKEFWVVTPNFLADQVDLVTFAMKHNLRNPSVKYQYFLRSFADAMRWQQSWRQFKEALAITEQQMNDRMKAVLIWKDPLCMDKDKNYFLDNEYFIANPFSESREGYLLTRINGKVACGKKMDMNTICGVVTLLLPFTTQVSDILGSFRVPPPITNEVLQVIAMVQLGRALMDEEELFVSRVVACRGGDVVANVGVDFTLAWRYVDIVGAFLCVKEIQQYLNGRQIMAHIAISAGKVSRVLRARGFDVKGTAVNDCCGLVRMAKDNTILMTKSFWYNLLQNAPEFKEHGEHLGEYVGSFLHAVSY